uniref:Ig-like domain-containing protein n=1 Tax=Echeneis naucrates TaxID=173247 RepID=A0A665VCE8_ECHNA
MFINCEPQCPQPTEECILHLCIRDFCPKEITVTWTKDGETLVSGVFNTPPSLNINGLYSMFSFLKISPSSEERGLEFRCQVAHSAQKESEERIFTLPNLYLTHDC